MPIALNNICVPLREVFFLQEQSGGHPRACGGKSVLLFEGKFILVFDSVISLVSVDGRNSVITVLFCLNITCFEIKLLKAYIM